MKIKRNISFKLRSYGKEGNLYQIRMRTTFNSTRIDLKTGCQINDIRFWNNDEELVKDGYAGPKGETARSINQELRLVKDVMEMVFQYFEVNNIAPSADRVRKDYENRLNGIIPKPVNEENKEKAKTQDLFKIFEEFMSECGEKNAWTEATFEKMNAMRVDLMNFNNRLKLTDLSETVLTEFIAYLRDTKKLKTPRKAKGDRVDYDSDDLVGLKNSTIEKKLGYLKWFLKWATYKGYNVNDAYKAFHPTLKKTQKKVIYLSKEEIAQIRNLPLPKNKEHLDLVRDVFLFCCFSGLRHSDAVNLRKSDIKDDHIEVTTIKTADSISIELNEMTAAILNKYKDYVFKDGRALPPYTNQAMNRDLKELCKLAGICEEQRITSYKGNQRTDEIYPKWALVGTHTGRRTFIVNSLSLGIPADVVMKWTGHSDYKAMKPYIDIVDSVKASEMKKLNSLIGK